MNQLFAGERGAFINDARVNTKHRLGRSKRKQQEAAPEGAYFGRVPPTGFARASFCVRGRHKLTALASGNSLSDGLFGGRRSQQTQMTGTQAADRRHKRGDA